MKYKLLALDVDGTLLGSNHSLCDRTVDAIAEAEAAGLSVCLATGRSYVETLPTWKQLSLRRPYQPMIVIGGAMVCEPDTGRTLYQKTIPRSIACEFADALGQAGHSAMAIVDSWRYGVDYFVTEYGDVHAAQRDWFSKMDVKVRQVPSLAKADDMPDPLRITAVVQDDQAEQLATELKSRFDGQLNIHAIVAPNYGVTIVEAFARRANKSTALTYVAQAAGIAPAQIVAVGDDVNDLAMIRGAGLGAAMPNATEWVRKVADYSITTTLADFIRELVAG